MLQPMQNQLTEFSLFHQNDNNIYHVTCKRVLQGYPQESCDDDYDYEFFFQSSNDPTTIFYVTCKLLSHSLIVDLLNKEIYGRDFDVNDLKCKYILTYDQKSNLKLNLEQIIPFYLCIPEGPDSNENASSFYGNIESNMTQTVLMIDDRSYFDNAMSGNDYTAQDGIEDYTRQFTYPQQF